MRTIMMACGAEIKVDDEDYERATEHKWGVRRSRGGGKGTVIRKATERGKKFNVSLVSYLYKPEPTDVIRYRNGDCHDFRRENVLIQKPILYKGVTAQGARRAALADVEHAMRNHLLRLKEIIAYHNLAVTAAEEEHQRVQSLLKGRMREKLKGHERRVLERDGDVTPEFIEELYVKQKQMCVYCYKKLYRKFHIDHIEPISKGGTHTRDNIQLLCPTCNIAKADKDAAEFRQANGFLF